MTKKGFLLLALSCVLGFTSPASGARKATWSAQPVDSDWWNPANWVPTKVPQATTTAVFGVSDITDITFSKDTHIHSIVFQIGASAYTIGLGTERAGHFQYFEGPIVNNSGTTQNFFNGGKGFNFVGNASAGRNTTYTTPGNEHMLPLAPVISFKDTSSAEAATFILNGGVINAFRLPTDLIFDDASTAAQATLIANGGPADGAGSQILLFGISTADQAQVELLGLNTALGIGSHAAPGAAIGSLEGDGFVYLGPFNLSIGGNNLDTTFAGVFGEGFGNTAGGSVTKIGTGRLILSGESSYSGGTTVEAGFLFIANSTGSATGAGPVVASGGTLGGTGIIAGAVIVGTGSGTGAILQPSVGLSQTAKLTIQSSVTCKADSTYTCQFSTQKRTADEVIANGVTIASGAQFALQAVGNKRLPGGTVFTIISNTAASAINGTFANLPDGSTLTAGRNKLLVSYTGGDGNDLTLTVVP